MGNIKTSTRTIRKKFVTLSALLLILVVNALAQGMDPGKAITERVNDVLCKIVLIILYITAAITTIVLILAGVKYMTSDDPTETSEAKTRIVYAFVGLIIVVVACPVIDYLVAKTDIAPFGKSCKCFSLGGGGTTTTTIQYQMCVDETPVGQCSQKTAASPTEGMRCVINPATGSPVLVSDPSCPVPVTTTTTSTTTTTTTSTTTTTQGPTTDKDMCNNAQNGGLCDGLNLISPNYKDDCCKDWGLCC